MDPYSLSVEREASKNIEENERECFKDAIVSSRSLNKGYVEPTRIRNAIPEIVSCIIAATFHIGVGLSMAYSAILVPNLEKDSSEIHATEEETSYIGSHMLQWFFAAVALGAAGFVWLMLPETHGKKLSEIEEYFHNNLLACGAEAKARKRRAKRRAQQNIQAAALQPLNPPKIVQVA
ncbi:uncharacterized protein LOC106643560 [Copidosoma floridanum]|uniref:uncharacterized protein LOC106643560 n=1 Tax=Copidosoma floridanum TaxID=29053 RepID=UPI0006C94BB7|nr:uncharacterized protein LOC106643560 [Copidosoma floridanum]